MRKEVEELNAHFATHKLEGARHIGWVRKFHGASNASFGNRSLITKWSPQLKKDFEKRNRENGWVIDTKKYPVRLVREKTLAFHPLLGQWGTRTAPNMPWSYGHLMFVASVFNLNQLPQ